MFFQIKQTHVHSLENLGKKKYNTLYSYKFLHYRKWFALELIPRKKWCGDDYAKVVGHLLHIYIYIQNNISNETSPDSKSIIKYLIITRVRRNIPYGTQYNWTQKPYLKRISLPILFVINTCVYSVAVRRLVTGHEGTVL